MGLSDVRTISQGNLGGCGGCALRIDGKRVQAPVNGECTVMLDGSVQGNVARTGGLGRRVAVTRQGTLLQSSDAFARSLVTANTCGRAHFYGPNTGQSFPSMCFTCMAFTRVKPFLTSSQAHVFTQYPGKNL